MTSERLHSPNFGEIADVFDRIRPGYPDDLATDVLAYAGTSAPRALEIGAGTGKATAVFTARGVRVTAVEPDAAMAALLTARQPDVTIVPATLEEYTPQERFDLLYCAQAWHWTDPDLRWEKAAAALASGGTIALFWNSDRLINERAETVLREVIGAHVPQLLYAFDEIPSDDDDLSDTWPGTDLAELPDFGDLQTRLYKWDRTLSGEDYLAYLNTRSTFRMLPRDLRDTLFGEVAGRMPESVTLAVETALYLARRR